MADEGSGFDRHTWMWWILVTALGNTAAIVVLSLIISALRVPVLGATGDGQPLTFLEQIALAPLFALAGAIVGAGQWSILRGLMLRAGWWILATAGGWMTGYMWSYFLFPPGSVSSSFFQLLLPWMLFGLAAGLFQWLVLRTGFERCGSWILIATVAMAIGASGWLIGGICGGVLLWMASGAFSGWALLRLPRKPLWPSRRKKADV